MTLKEIFIIGKEVKVMKTIYKKILWVIIGMLEKKMDNEASHKKAYRLYCKMERLKAIAYDL